jgi:hypothetical protein
MPAHARGDRLFQAWRGRNQVDAEKHHESDNEQFDDSSLE